MMRGITTIVESLKSEVPKEKNRYESLSLQKGLRILETFSMERPTQTLSEIARNSGVNVSTAYRLLSTLEGEGFVERLRGGSAYSLSLRMFELGSVVLHGMDLNIAGVPVLARLATETGETTYLTVLSGDVVLCIARVEGIKHLRSQFLDVGRRLPLHGGAASKVFLAHLPVERARELLATSPLIPFTEKTITDPEVLLSSLPHIRTHGYAMSDEEITRGITAVACPVFDSGGGVVAALTLSGATSHFGPSYLPSLIEKARDAAYEVSVRVGYVPGFNG
jgi:DNA-binding IclR family transcriptional regulator